MKAQDFAKQAADILNARGTQNGYDAGEERSAATIAKVFNLVTGRDLTEAEAWTFLICLKLVREGRKHQDDNCLDLANYAYLLAECNQPTRQTGRVHGVFRGGPTSLQNLPKQQTGGVELNMQFDGKSVAKDLSLLTSEQIQDYIESCVKNSVCSGDNSRYIATGNHPEIKD